MGRLRLPIDSELWLHRARTQAGDMSHLEICSQIVSDNLNQYVKCYSKALPQKKERPFKTEAFIASDNRLMIVRSNQLAPIDKIRFQDRWSIFGTGKTVCRGMCSTLQHAWGRHKTQLRKGATSWSGCLLQERDILIQVSALHHQPIDTYQQSVTQNTREQALIKSQFTSMKVIIWVNNKNNNKNRTPM